MISARAFSVTARLQSKRGICEYLGGISPATYDTWQSRGLVPGPVAGTARYDRRAHDLVLDRRTGLEQSATPVRRSPLEEWESGHSG
jgi:hypothetical protein